MATLIHRTDVDRAINILLTRNIFGADAGGMEAWPHFDNPAICRTQYNLPADSTRLIDLFFESDCEEIRVDQFGGLALDDFRDRVVNVFDKGGGYFQTVMTPGSRPLSFAGWHYQGDKTLTYLPMKILETSRTARLPIRPVLIGDSVRVTGVPRVVRIARHVVGGSFSGR